MADIKRKIARAVAVLSVAFGAGHLVQSMPKTEAPLRTVRTQVLPEPKDIQTVAATDVQPVKTSRPKPVVTASGLAVPKSTPVEKPATPILLAAAGATEPAVQTPAARPGATPMQLEKPVVKVPIPAPLSPAKEIACSVTLDLMADPHAVIGLMLQAPCHADERVVLKHAGLAISAVTTSNGALFTGIPALESTALVEVLFADGQSIKSSISMADVSRMHRFGVQWQADDAFQVHAFENGSGYDGPGHVSATDPHRMVTGVPSVGGFLTLLGDSSVKNPLLAEVYTFPADPTAKPEVIVEAAVTPTTCGRELLGETLNSIGGKVYVTDLTLAMPDCTAVGDYMVLKNLVLDLNIAAAE